MIIGGIASEKNGEVGRDTKKVEEIPKRSVYN
jgi:hypothetical protein